MRELTKTEVQELSGAGVFGNIAAGLGAAAAVSGGLASIPTPASPALGAFTVVTGLLAAGASYLDSNVTAIQLPGDSGGGGGGGWDWSWSY